MPNTPYILGIDLGTNSLGWAAIEVDKKDLATPVGLLNAGAVVIPEAVEGDIKSGKDESKNKERQEARARRRQLDRRKRRRFKILNILKEMEFLPETSFKNGLHRPDYFADLDRMLKTECLKRHPEHKYESPRFNQVFPYILRADALETKISPYEIGRALSHLSQRRGFLSNRKTPIEDDKEKGKVSQGIKELREEMEEAGAETLGQYFSMISPEENRIRQRYTRRDMYRHEFELIWESQARFYPEVMTDKAKSKLEKAIFNQRPLKSQKHLIGRCELESGHRRAPLASLEAQEFRILQKVNDLAFSINDCPPQPIISLPEDREKIIEQLMSGNDLTFPKIKSILGFKRNEKVWFNLAEGGNKKIPGNRTVAAMATLFGKDWFSMEQEIRDTVYGDFRSIQDPELLVKRASNIWGLPKDRAQQAKEIHLEEGYTRHSKKAMLRLIERMRDGTSYATAKKELYPATFQEMIYDRLPPFIDTHLKDVSNPTVVRCMRELRKTVNAIITKYGKPESIRIELARDLKRSRFQRDKVTKQNRSNEKRREEAKKLIKEDFPGMRFSGADIQKVLLAKECDWKCPYTGKAISMEKLVGSNPEFDIEHIIPYSRCGDNSYLNKTLCHAGENRNVKKNQTPYEAYSDTRKWNEILHRIASLRGDDKVRREKMARFMCKDIEEFGDFSNRMLSDTRYASRIARDYLGLLYGANARQKVKGCSGQGTAMLRNAWCMNSILNDGGKKLRNDHRHHAVDAIVIALTSDSTIQKLSKEAQKLESMGKRLSISMQMPWPGFIDEARETIKNIKTSHRPNRRVRGKLHEDTFYARREENGTAFYATRKDLQSLGNNDVESIIDPAVRKLIRDYLGGLAPDKAFKDPKNLPTGQNGKRIKKVMIRVKATPVEIGNGSVRKVKTGGNHHMEIIESQVKGKKVWNARMVTMLEAHIRLSKGLPVVDKSCAENERFVMTIYGGDVLKVKHNGIDELLHVRIITNKKDGIYVETLRINDARVMSKISPKKKENGYFKYSIKQLGELGTVKKIITPLGEEKRQND